jgi:hypothetical protein
MESCGSYFLRGVAETVASTALSADSLTRIFLGPLPSKRISDLFIKLSFQHDL